jgi:hypothetical protein
MTTRTSAVSARGGPRAERFLRPARRVEDGKKEMAVWRRLARRTEGTPATRAAAAMDGLVSGHVPQVLHLIALDGREVRLDI